jgi:very-short-patch-repair endonuclease
MKIKKICEGCKKEYESDDWRNYKFCSHKCANERPNSSRFQKGNVPWIKGKENKWGHHTKEVKIRISEKNIGMPNPNARFNPQIFKKGRKIPEEQLKKILGKQGKSSLEIKFEDLIKHLGLPYKFVGNGEIMIARKVPDFVNSNGEKIAIEVFYRRHKQLFRGGLEEWKAERARIFTENGWKIIFFDETEVNSKIISEKLNVKTGG